ncbi:MAG: phospholipase [Chlamydiae bacterium CG10_big_fil_rev_8_21_14_0_10_35_9]|nr:MAG: phospholipase [Chlamydiae bacterium CG10_big_fil_rev_8_21_14_0_10_35_9]
MHDLENSEILRKSKKFSNPHIKKIKRSFWHVILWKLGFYDEIKRREKPPNNFSYPVEKKFDSALPSVCWVNHCTFLVKVGGVTFLTDPILSKYCSPLPISSLKRKHPPGLELSDLPQLDCILISHNHYDHLDRKTVIKINALYPSAIWVVPKNLKSWFLKRNIRNIYELGWWESFSCNGTTITAVPAQHFSGRTIFDINKTLWNGYVVESFTENKKFYFSGDTGYNDKDFKEIGKKFNGIDLGIIPIGTYCPREFMKTVHINPDEAVRIHTEVSSKFSIGMHWKTFKLSDEPLELPPYDLYLAMKKVSLPFREFVAVEPGLFLNW